MRPDWYSRPLLVSLFCGGVLWCGRVHAAEVAPDIGFLEYLGGLVEQGGDWVGPDDMGQGPDEGESPAISEAGARPKDDESEEKP